MSSPDPSTWDAIVLSEITSYAVEALARFGAPGELRIVGGELTLQGPTGTTRAELGSLPPMWTSLSEEARRRRTGELVRRLLSHRSASQGVAPKSSVPSWVWLAVLGAVGAAGAAVYNSKQATTSEEDEVVRRKQGATAQLSPAEGSEEDRHARARRVCETTRERVMRGATVGPTDVEGWVVDVLVLKKGGTEPLDSHPALRTFLKDPASTHGSQFIWSEEPELASLPGSDTRVLVRRELIQGESAERTPGVRLTFSGRLTDHYFDAEKRRSFFHVISSLADALSGTHAGLFARCEGGETHHVGSWFRGATPGDAAASLVYMMGTYALPMHVAEPFLHPPTKTDVDRAHAFSSVQSAESKLDQRAIAALVGKSGGMISGPNGGPFVISFPFSDGNRSSRASRDLARATSIGSD